MHEGIAIAVADQRRRALGFDPAVVVEDRAHQRPGGSDAVIR